MMMNKVSSSRQHRRPWNFQKCLLLPSLIALIVTSFGLNLWQAIQHTSNSHQTSDVHHGGSQSASLESFIALPKNSRQLDEAAKIKVLETDLVQMSNELKKAQAELLRPTTTATILATHHHTGK
jgi:hypothetical protein